MDYEDVREALADMPRADLIDMIMNVVTREEVLIIPGMCLSPEDNFHAGWNAGLRAAKVSLIPDELL